MEGLALDPHLQHPPVEAQNGFPSKGVLHTAVALSTDIQALMQEFWSLALPVRLLSIAENPHYYWHTQDFYVAQKGLDEEGRRWAQVRVSEGLCRHLFETTLGKPVEEPDFLLSHIRNFEVFLLERFSRKLFQLFSPKLIKKPSRHAPPPEQDKLVHLVWVTQGEPDQVNQIILTLPQVCLKMLQDIEEAPPPRWYLSDEKLIHATAEVVACLGTTAAKLEDLQQLEPGDLIVFENSHPSQWFLLDPVTQDWVTAYIQVPDTLRLPDLPLQQGNLDMSSDTQLKQNIWDSLQVEVTAKFNPIRLPLKQIKEMEQGLVIEIADLMDNQIQVEVEGHAIAWGELVVIGDKFGVRVMRVDEAPASLHDNSENMSTMPLDQPAALPAERYSTEDLDDTAQAESSGDLMDDLDLDESDFDDLDDEEDWS